MKYDEMAEQIEASSLHSNAPLFSLGFGVQFNVGDFLRSVYALDFTEMSSLERVDCIFQLSFAVPPLTDDGVSVHYLC